MVASKVKPPIYFQWNFNKYKENVIEQLSSYKTFFSLLVNIISYPFSLLINKSLDAALVRGLNQK